jgi:hypothetical protein
VNLADRDSAAGKFRVRRVGVVDDDLQSVHRARRRVDQTFPERYRARRAGWGDLHEAKVLIDSLIVVDDEPELVGVERLGPVHIGNREDDEFNLVVDDGKLPIGTDNDPRT